MQEAGQKSLREPCRCCSEGRRKIEDQQLKGGRHQTQTVEPFARRPDNLIHCPYPPWKAHDATYTNHPQGAGGCGWGCSLSLRCPSAQSLLNASWAVIATPKLLLCQCQNMLCRATLPCQPPRARNLKLQSCPSNVTSSDVKELPRSPSLAQARAHLQQTSTPMLASPALLPAPHIPVAHRQPQAPGWPPMPRPSCESGLEIQRRIPSAMAAAEAAEAQLPVPTGSSACGAGCTEKLTPLMIDPLQQEGLARLPAELSPPWASAVT